ncbi:hypothetical protein EVAR_8441_1 [Eumeta japonica]|uniref:Uncharacterized protein n=1 Tax=Eumeta variegata TaxID=151549 RepID=A0A4C1WCQ6_EUMVA|nr:hypothetical protein EVAR_8441_1 [Eumeta japonica]
MLTQAYLTTSLKTTFKLVHPSVRKRLAKFCNSCLIPRISFVKNDTHLPKKGKRKNKRKAQRRAPPPDATHTPTPTAGRRLAQGAALPIIFIL